MRKMQNKHRNATRRELIVVGRRPCQVTIRPGMLLAGWSDGLPSNRTKAQLQTRTWEVFESDHNEQTNGARGERASIPKVELNVSPPRINRGYSLKVPLRLMFAL